VMREMVGGRDVLGEVGKRTKSLGSLNVMPRMFPNHSWRTRDGHYHSPPSCLPLEIGIEMTDIETPNVPWVPKQYK